MKSSSLPAKLYLAVVYLAGVTVLFFHAIDMELVNPWLLAVLCCLGSLALILKVEGTTNRSHYTFSFVIYGFTLIAFGINDTILVILVSNIVEWLWYRSPWSVKFFNISVYILATEAAVAVYLLVCLCSPSAQWVDVLAIVLGMAALAVINHLMMGTLIWLTHRGAHKTSGAFDPFTLFLDVSLLYFGATLSLVWEYNPSAIVLFIIPTHLLYRALRIPALERKTELDGKTGLFNHAYFKKQLDGELARSRRFDRPLSVIIADLDLLRNINNTYGHLAGDEVLIGVAKAMKQSVREYDVVSRFGGEEFAILLPETTLVQACEKAEFFRKMIEAMEFNVPTSLIPIRATMSFGVAQRESFAQNSNDIVHNADLALYRSKLNGRNRTFAHDRNLNIDFPPGTLENQIVSAGFDLSTSSPYILETYMQTNAE